MESLTVETPYGQIRLWGEAEAFTARGPVVVAIAGAFAEERGALFQLAPYLAPAASTVVGHLPGNHAPTLVSASVGVYAAAYSHAIREAFADRDVVTCGASVGGLVALALDAPQIRRAVVVEPPLVMSKVWPLRPILRRILADRTDDADVRVFIANVFGVTETAAEERLYDGLLDRVAVPTHVLVGDQPLYPERDVTGLPSLVDEPERARLAAHPGITLTVVPGAGHNVPQQAAPQFVTILREEVAKLSAS